jgi:P4 family phage/plasmid primase-like protien
VKFDPTAKCSMIDKFLSDVLESEDDKQLFYELVGSTLWKEYFLEKAFMFMGNGRNGKDKSIELIKRLLGVKNCCAVPLSALEPKGFVTSHFLNKMANLSGEIDNKDLKDTATFKAFIGRSLLSGDRKFKSYVDFVNYAKFIFACNNLPMVYDNSKGFWERWEIMNFPYTFVIQEEYDKSDVETKKFLKIKDPFIIDKITTQEEMSGLLNKALEGLDTIRKNKSFSFAKGSDNIKKFWITKSNSVMAFCFDCIEPDNESKILKKTFRKKYSEFCKKVGVMTKSDMVIKRTLEDLYGCSEVSMPEPDNPSVWNYAWEGIKFKNISTL